MLFYQVHLEGTEDEIQKMIDELSEYDEFFSEEVVGTDFDLTEDGNPEISDVDEVEEMANALTSAAPDAKFTIVGTVENHDYYMDFEIAYDSKEMVIKSSDWYDSYFICRENFKNYEDFCDITGLESKVSREQFDEWLKEECEISVLDSGEGEVCLKAPLSKRVKSPWDDIEFTRCPVCGEMCDYITPPIIGKDGKMYHWWCAEDEKIDGIVYGTGEPMIGGFVRD